MFGYLRETWRSTTVCVIFPSRGPLAVSEDIFDCHIWVFLVDAAEHPTMHRAEFTLINNLVKMSTVPRLRNSDLEALLVCVGCASPKIFSRWKTMPLVKQHNTVQSIPVVWPPESYLTSLCIKVFTYKTGTVKVPTSQCSRIRWVNIRPSEKCARQTEKTLNKFSYFHSSPPWCLVFHLEHIRRSRNVYWMNIG